jgi:hypothetical protein
MSLCRQISQGLRLGFSDCFFFSSKRHLFLTVSDPLKTGVKPKYESFFICEEFVYCAK